MLTHLELAQISKQIYFKNGGFLPGWTIKKYYTDKQGLAVGAYENRYNEMVIAFRGTDTGSLENFVKNILTNIKIFLGEEPDSEMITNAYKFVQDTRNTRDVFSRLVSFLNSFSSNQLYIVGHSLGGFIAQRRLRHKVSKSSYQTAFRLVIGMHYIFWLGWFIASQALG